MPVVLERSLTSLKIDVHEKIAQERTTVFRISVGPAVTRSNEGHVAIGAEGLSLHHCNTAMNAFARKLVYG